MLVSTSCPSCILAQMERIASIKGLERSRALEMIKMVMELMISMDWDNPPPVIAKDLYRAVANFLGVEDPYKEIKERHIGELLKIYGELKEMVEKSSNPVKKALVLSAAGNAVDLGAQLSLEGSASKIFSLPEHTSFYLDETDAFIEEIKNVKKLTIIGDNAGETVLDRILLETLKKHVDLQESYYIVRGGPIINDTTYRDATLSGIQNVSTIVESGSPTPGFYPPEVSERAREIFFREDMVILSKGQGNFETLEGVERRVYLSFKVKCDPVSKLLNIPKGSLVFMKNEKRKAV